MDDWATFIRVASPRSRGWTHHRVAGRHVAPGFPALAGMDLVTPRAHPDSNRLPRARGDGPAPHAHVTIRSSASPRSRGWTPECAEKGTNTGGFPALAGMDPGLSVDRWPCTGLPRARGDGPGKGQAVKGATVASPRSRGWTRRAGIVDVRDQGFPALAGMDRIRGIGGRGSQWLPRARGDGPTPGGTPYACRTASPRSRGWTGVAAADDVRGDGFPALAGMDP